MRRSALCVSLTSLLLVVLSIHHRTLYSRLFHGFRGAGSTAEPEVEADVSTWEDIADTLPPPIHEELEWRRNLGRVPFYLYEGPEWTRITGKTFLCGRRVKCCSEFYFLRQLRNHPWRVSDPEQAVVLIPPVMISDFNPKLDTGPEGQDRLRQAFARIGELTRPNYNRTHLMVIGHWSNRSIHNKLQWSLSKMISQRVIFADGAMDVAGRNAHKQVQIIPVGLSMRRPQFLDNLAGPWSFESLSDYKRRPYRWNMIGQADDRQAYVERVQAFRQFSKAEERSALVLTSDEKFGKGKALSLPQCDAETGFFHGCQAPPDFRLEDSDRLVQQSQYVLVVRGDNGGSQRIHQSAAFSTLMVVIGASVINEGLPFHCEIPWRDIVYVFPDQEILWTDSVLSTVESTVGEDADVERRLQLYRQHAPDFVWELPNSRVASNVLLEAGKRAHPDELRAAGLSALSFSCIEGSSDWRFSDLASYS